MPKRTGISPCQLQWDSFSGVYVYFHRLERHFLLKRFDRYSEIRYGRITGVTLRRNGIQQKKSIWRNPRDEFPRQSTQIHGIPW